MKEFFGVILIFLGILVMLGAWAKRKQEYQSYSESISLFGNWGPIIVGALMVGIGLKLLKIT